MQGGASQSPCSEIRPASSTPPIPSPQASRAPVLVFFHNAAEEDVSKGQLAIDGSFLAAIGNLIVVTANYRTGVFGFLRSGELLEPLEMLLVFRYFLTKRKSFSGS